jgi:MFS family permease
MLRALRQRIASDGVYTPAILLLAFVVGTSFLGVGFIVPLRALYGRQVGASSGEIGLMASAALLTGFFAAPPIGRLSDRVGHGYVLFAGLVIHTLLVLAYIPIENPVLLIALRGLEGIAVVGILPPARALANTLAPSGRQAETLGLLSAAQTVGILLGPTVGLLLANAVGYHEAFLVASAPLAVGAVLAWFFLPRRATTSSGPAASRVATAALFTRPLLLAYGLQIVLATSQGVGAAVWTIYMADLGASPLMIGLSFTTFAVPIILLAPIAGRMADRYGRYWYVLLGLAVCGVLFVIYGLPIAPIWLVILSVPEGIAAAFARTATDGLLADATPPSLRGRIQAAYSAAGTGSAFVVATISGFIYGMYRGLPFIMVGGIFFAGAVVLLLPQVARMFVVGAHKTVLPPESALPAEEMGRERVVSAMSVTDDGC